MSYTGPTKESIAGCKGCYYWKMLDGTLYHCDYSTHPGNQTRSALHPGEPLVHGRDCPERITTAEYKKRKEAERKAREEEKRNRKKEEKLMELSKDFLHDMAEAKQPGVFLSRYAIATGADVEELIKSCKDYGIKFNATTLAKVRRKVKAAHVTGEAVENREIRKAEKRLQREQQEQCEEPAEDPATEPEHEPAPEPEPEKPAEQAKRIDVHQLIRALQKINEPLAPVLVAGNYIDSISVNTEIDARTGEKKTTVALW